MAQGKTPKRVGDYNPDVEAGELLDGIEGQEVTLTDITFDLRNGKKGEYVLSVVTVATADGEAKYHTGGAVVAERLARALDVPTIEQLREMLRAGAHPDRGNLPILATFSQERSQSNPGQKYWTVS
jgi:hypothetical protein